VDNLQSFPDPDNQGQTIDIEGDAIVAIAYVDANKSRIQLQGSTADVVGMSKADVLTQLGLGGA